MEQQITTAVEAVQDARIEVLLFGGFQVRVGSSEVRFPTRKGQALVAYLAIVPGKSHEREKLCALLWEESQKVQAQASLRQTILTVRKALSPYSRSALRATATTVALDAPQVRVDVAMLEQHIAEGTVEALERIVEMCPGPLMDGFIAGQSSFDEWLAFERMRTQELVVGALEKLVEMHTTAGDLGRATRAALHSFRLDPLRERTHRALMRLYAIQGRRTDAVRQFEECRTILARELEVEPEAETTRLHRDILRDGVGVEGGTLSAPTAKRLSMLVGREAERARLDEALDEAWSECGRLVVLRGDAGVGKTRLLEEAASCTLERGGSVMRGRCFESEQVLPFALWADLVRTGGSPLRAMLDRDLPHAARTELGRILPLGIEGDDTNEQVPRDERQLFEAFGILLDSACKRAPLLILLEDLQWADAMSLRLLSFAVRHLSPSSRICLMATVRAETLAESTFLRTILQEVQREQRLVEMDVLPLSRADTAVLMRSLSPSASEEAARTLFERVWAVSEGNPLVVLELMRDADKAALSPDVTRLPVPLRVREIISEHVARLPPRCQEALATAAVIGRQFDFTLLQCSCRGSDYSLAMSVEELVRARFLQSAGDGFYFTHDRIREVVYESMLLPRRRVLHGAVARALEETYSTRIDDVCGAIGYHFAHAGEATESIRYLMRFAERTSRNHGLEEALGALGEASRQLPALSAQHRDETGVAIAVARAQCLLFLGRVAEMEPTLGPYRATIEQLELPVLRASFHQLEAFAHASLGDRQKAEEQESRLLAMVERSDDARLAGTSLSQISHDASIAGTYRSGINYGLKAVAMLEKADDPESEAFAWINLASNYIGAGDCSNCLDAAARAIAIGQRSNITRVQALALMIVGLVRAVGLGEMTAALAASRQAIELASDPYIEAWAHHGYVRICTFGSMILYVSPRPVLDEAFEASLAAMEELARAPLEGPLGPWAGMGMLALAEAHLVKGDAERARAVARSTLEVLGVNCNPQARGAALRVLGYAELALGDIERAAETFEEARRYAEPISAFETAAALAGLGLVEVARRDLVAAGPFFRDALETYGALGMTFWTQIIRRMADDYGVTI